MSVSQWLKQHPLAPGEEIAVTELDRTESASLHVVHIRHREALHVHQHHDLTVMVQQGHGILRLGPKNLRLKPGSVVLIPRGAPHAFVNESRKPAAALVVFSPPLESPDSIPVSE